MRVVTVLIAPVPVGHRVELTWFEEVSRGLVPGQERVDDRPHQPLIRDLDTGVEYASDWVLGVSRRRRPDVPFELGEVPRTELRVQRRATGVVRACRLVTVRGFPELEVQTHLEVEEA
jgi:hypothetical protein